MIERVKNMLDAASSKLFILKNITLKQAEEDVLFDCNERAGILEHDAHLSREVAEVAAAEMILKKVTRMSDGGVTHA